MRDLVAALLGARLRLAFSARGAALLRVANGGRRRSTKVATLAWDEDPSLDAARLVERCAPLFAGVRCAARPLTIALGASQVRLFMVTPPHNVGRMSDLRAAAARRFQVLYGDGLEDWQIAFDADVRTPFLACAVPRLRMAALHALAEANGLRLVGVEPRFAAAWNQLRAGLDGAWLAVADDGLLTLATTVSDPRPRLLGVHQVRLPAHWAGRNWLHEQVNRVALREGVAPPERVIGWRERPGEEPPASVIDLPRQRLRLVSAPAAVPRREEAAG